MEVEASLARVVDALRHENAGADSGSGSGSADTPRVAIAVRDRGIGIPTRDQQRIFERFYRVDRARARDTGGSGLGLAIVNHVVRNHHGEITVASTEGMGSTFTLLLPGYARAAAEPSIGSVKRAAMSGPTPTPSIFTPASRSTANEL